MKKILLFLGIVSVVVALMARAWALPDNSLSQEYNDHTFNGYIKTTGGVIYSVNVNAVNVSAGDKIQLMDGGPSGVVRITCIASSTTTTGTLSCSPSYGVGALFNNNIYLKETLTNNQTGNFYTDVQFF